MKLNGKTMAMVVAMAIGVLGATGCSKPGSDDAIAPEESVANAPVEESSATAGFEQNARYHYYGRSYYAPYGPPAVRYERYGRAPSARHFWAPGYYRWDGRQHVWMGGRWEVRRHGYEYVSPHWERHYGRWMYIPGHWVRR